MGSVKDYFKGLGSGIVSLVKGLQVTGSELVTPKITEYYPEDRDTYKWPKRFRAILTLKYDAEGNHKCIACGTCERVCPNGTIKLETRMDETWDGKKKKKLDKYWYDLGSCTFCDLCVVNCPTDALEFSNDFEQAVFTRAKLLKKLNYLPEKPEPKPTPEQLAKLEAEKQAKIEAAKAAAAAKSAGAEPQLDEKALATIANLQKAVDAAATDEEKAAAQNKLDKVKAALIAKAKKDAAAAAPAADAEPELDDKAKAAIANLQKAVDAATTDEEKAAAQNKLDKVKAALIAKAKKDAANQ